jgi:hypothetical protein
MTMTHEHLSDFERRELRPGAFCQMLLLALDAAEGQTRRRKRDQAPDRFGLAVKRDLLERAAEDDPAPADFEGWLLSQIGDAPAAGPVRAMCEQIFLEYRMARSQPELADWLARGAPSDDADGTRTRRRRTGAAPRREPDGSAEQRGNDRWHGRDEQAYDCTCHLPLR